MEPGPWAGLGLPQLGSKAALEGFQTLFCQKRRKEGPAWAENLVFLLRRCTGAEETCVRLVFPLEVWQLHLRQPHNGQNAELPVGWQSCGLIPVLLQLFQLMPALPSGWILAGTFPWWLVKGWMPQGLPAVKPASALAALLISRLIPSKVSVYPGSIVSLGSEWLVKVAKFGVLGGLRHCDGTQPWGGFHHHVPWPFPTEPNLQILLRTESAEASCSSVRSLPQAQHPAFTLVPMLRTRILPLSFCPLIFPGHISPEMELAPVARDETMEKIHAVCAEEVPRSALALLHSVVVFGGSLWGAKVGSCVRKFTINCWDLLPDLRLESAVFCGRESQDFKPTHFFHLHFLLSPEVVPAVEASAGSNMI